VNVGVLAPDRSAEQSRRELVDSSTPRPASTRLLVALVVVGTALRLVWILHNGSSFDESFSAMIGRRSLGGILDALRTTDSHPPLDYLLRAPLARAGHGALGMRLPSFVFSVGALSLFAWWVRGRGIAGLVAVAVMAMSPFQIMYGGEARMYALLELLGVAGVVLGEAWLRAPKRWHAPVAGALVLIGVFDHVSGFLFAAGLLALAGWRADRGAWRWRIAITAALALWAVVWGSSFLVQAGTTHASWIARTSPSAVADAVAAQVTAQHGVAVLVVALVVAGVALIVATDRLLTRLMFCCAVLPVVLAAVVGIFVPFFIDRTLTVAAWAPCLAIGVLVQWAFRRSVVIGAAAALLVGALILPATAVFLQRRWEYDTSVERLLAVSQPGDVVAAVPAWYGPLVDWRVGVQAHGAARPVRVAALPAAHGILLGDRAATGRVWVLSFSGDHRRFTGIPRCAPDWTDGTTTVSCLTVAPPTH
jgi:hypothetical protein